MSDFERKKLLARLETDFRRTETALAIAQADFEKAYTAMFDYMNEYGDGPPRMLVFTPDVTMH